MELIIKKQIGKRIYTFVCAGETLHEAVMESERLSFGDVAKCDLCGSDDLRLCAHVAQNKFKYTEIRCFKCRASLTFGQRQDDPKTFYLRKTEEAKYDWKAYQPASV